MQVLASVNIECISIAESSPMRERRPRRVAAKNSEDTIWCTLYKWCRQGNPYTWHAVADVELDLHTTPEKAAAADSLK